MQDMPPPFDALWFELFVGLVVGLALGSFVTMLSYRLPRRLSIMRPDSFCPLCKTSLGVRDLVPVLSWLASRGACRHCHTKISARYPLIEIITALCCMSAFALIGFQWWLLVAVMGIVGMVTAGVVCLECKER